MNTDNCNLIYISDLSTVSYPHAPNTVKRYSELRKTIPMSHRAPRTYWVLPVSHTYIYIYYITLYYIYLSYDFLWVDIYVYDYTYLTVNMQISNPNCKEYGSWCSKCMFRIIAKVHDFLVWMLVILKIWYEAITQEHLCFSWTNQHQPSMESLRRAADLEFWRMKNINPSPINR